MTWAPWHTKHRSLLLSEKQGPADNGQVITSGANVAFKSRAQGRSSPPKFLHDSTLHIFNYFPSGLSVTCRACFVCAAASCKHAAEHLFVRSQHLRYLHTSPPETSPAASSVRSHVPGALAGSLHAEGLEQKAKNQQHGAQEEQILQDEKSLQAELPYCEQIAAAGNWQQQPHDMEASYEGPDWHSLISARSQRAQHPMFLAVHFHVSAHAHSTT